MASVVCKRWRSVALSVVTRIPDTLAVSPELLPRLPSLTHLRLPAELVISQVPQSLRSLCFPCVRHGQDLTTVAALTTVTELDIGGPYFAVMPVLEIFASSLTSLALHGDRTFDLLPQVLDREMRFPHVTRLHVARPTVSRGGMTSLSQLRSAFPALPS